MGDLDQAMLAALRLPILAARGLTIQRVVPQAARLLAPCKTSRNFATVTKPSNLNPHLAADGLHDTDFLYHLGLTAADKKDFTDVKFLCMGGTPGRMENFAQRVSDEFSSAGLFNIPEGTKVEPIGKQDRYSIFKVGPVLISSHGMGMPSFSILLHEMTKLLTYAEAADVTYMRLGSSGGVGVEGGTVVAATHGMNGMLEPTYRLAICGKMVERHSEFSAELCDEIIQSSPTDIPTVKGKTMGSDCFFEGQGRLDGAICDYTLQDKFDFLDRAHAEGVRNIEMEANMFGAFANHLGIKAASISVTLLNRLNGDQVDVPPEIFAAWDDRPGQVAISFIKQKLLAEK